MSHPKPKSQVNSIQFALFVLLGILVGVVLGYVFMGTVHAVLEIGADKHWGQ